MADGSNTARRSNVTRRKVCLPCGIRQCGVYNPDGSVAREIVPGMTYFAKFNGESIPVSAMPDYERRQVLYHEVMLIGSEDPRISAGKAEARARGFDLRNGNYTR